MQTIPDFISQAAGQLGVGEESVRTATSGLLRMISEQADDADADRFIAQSQAGQDLVGRILGQMPALKQLLG